MSAYVIRSLDRVGIAVGREWNHTRSPCRDPFNGEGVALSMIGNMPLFAMLRTRMHWHQERQRLLAENIANANSQGYRPRDLAPPEYDQMKRGVTPIGLARTSGAHIALAGGTGQFEASTVNGGKARPSGNAVNLEEETMKVANNQMDYQAATTLYVRSLGLIKTAIGKR
jgi:flagellar basal-body rod protein FlgB